MKRALEWILAAGASGGLIWYVMRTEKKARDMHRASEEHELSARFQGDFNRSLALASQAIASARPGLSPAPAAPPATLPAAPPSPPAVPAARGLTREFDALFARHGAGIPVPYLRALAQAESGMRPHDPLGLINVTPIALADHNRRNPGRVVRSSEMRDPATNITVAAGVLHEIIASYERNHGDVPNLRADWTNLRFVQLLTFGWSAGHSEREGVGRVVRYLKAQPATLRPREITIDTIYRRAQQAAASRHLADPRKLAYSMGVAAAFAREVERDRLDRATGLS